MSKGRKAAEMDRPTKAASTRDRVRVKSRVRRATGPLLAGLLMVWVYVGYAQSGPFELDVTLLAIVYAILALGMYVPVILGGHIDMAYNAYFAAGAYAVALIGTRTDLPVLLGLLVGATVAALLATAVALVTSHLTGFHLAFATLLVGIAVFRWISTSESVTGGTVGIGGIPQASIFGHQLDREDVVVLGLILTWLLAVGLTCFRRGVVGTALRLQRESPIAAESYGIPVRPLQGSAMALGAAIASLAGGLFALMNSFILAESFTITIIFVILFLPFVGGALSPWGAVLGAAAITVVEQKLSFAEGSSELMFGIATLAIFLLAPAGLLGLPAVTWRWARRLRRTSRA